jgi:hypothetical protein
MDDLLVILTNGGIFRSAIGFGRGYAIEIVLTQRRQLTMVRHCRCSIDLTAIGAGSDRILHQSKNTSN